MPALPQSRPVPNAGDWPRLGDNPAKPGTMVVFGPPQMPRNQVHKYLVAGQGLARQIGVVHVENGAAILVPADEDLRLFMESADWQNDDKTAYEFFEHILRIARKWATSNANTSGSGRVQPPELSPRQKREVEVVTYVAQCNPPLAVKFVPDQELESCALGIDLENQNAPRIPWTGNGLAVLTMEPLPTVFKDLLERDDKETVGRGIAACVDQHHAYGIIKGDQFLRNYGAREDGTVVGFDYGDAALCCDMPDPVEAMRLERDDVQKNILVDALGLSEATAAEIVGEMRCNKLQSIPRKSTQFEDVPMQPCPRLTALACDMFKDALAGESSCLVQIEWGNVCGTLAHVAQEIFLEAVGSGLVTTVTGLAVFTGKGEVVEIATGRTLPVFASSLETVQGIECGCTDEDKYLASDFFNRAALEPRLPTIIVLDFARWRSPSRDAFRDTAPGRIAFLSGIEVDLTPLKTETTAPLLPALRRSKVMKYVSGSQIGSLEKLYLGLMIDAKVYLRALSPGKDEPLSPDLQDDFEENLVKPFATFRSLRQEETIAEEVDPPPAPPPGDVSSGPGTGKSNVIKRSLLQRSPPGAASSSSHAVSGPTTKKPLLDRQDGNDDDDDQMLMFSSAINPKPTASTPGKCTNKSSPAGEKSSSTPVEDEEDDLLADDAPPRSRSAPARPPEPRAAVQNQSSSAAVQNQSRTAAVADHDDNNLSNKDLKLKGKEQEKKKNKNSKKDENNGKGKDNQARRSVSTPKPTALLSKSYYTQAGRKVAERELLRSYTRLQTKKDETRPGEIIVFRQTKPQQESADQKRYREHNLDQLKKLIETATQGKRLEDLKALWRTGERQEEEEEKWKKTKNQIQRVWPSARPPLVQDK
ncbi:unnamed protein product [Amoebophrya sp. A120]|nr:unnamed protein product [Amoebophrya sp. A120]|eukprot:GSA120T00025855001.1